MKNALLAALAAAVLVGSGTAAWAGDKNTKNFAEKHPRRAQVIHRENKDKQRINAAEKAGKITKGQQQKLDKEENAIRRQERAEAAANGGHITKGEQRQLNREEHRVERQGARMEKRDAAKQGGNAGGAAAGGNTGGSPAPANNGGTPAQ